jgi:gamma-glutamyltranspeptidase/glutathione hydrolase
MNKSGQSMAKAGRRRPGFARRSAGLLALGLAVASCSTLNSVKDTMLGTSSASTVQGFLGGVVADEPRAALAGRQVLASGGNAADAATAVAFALAVTLPSRAGLGGGGACVAYFAGPKTANGGAAEAVMFVPPAATGSGAADRPAEVPMLARGLFLLQARYGSRQIESLIAPAEQMARFGVPASRALTRDITEVSGPLFADPAARAVFGPGGVPLAEGGLLVQPDLGATLAQLRIAGVGDMHLGGLAKRVVQGSPVAGGPISLADLRAALPTLAATLDLEAGNDIVSFLPPPADGGLAAAAAFQTLWQGRRSGVSLDVAGARADAVAARWRSGGGDPMSLLREQLPPASLPALPASTSFVTLDRDGNSVACALSVNNLFGTGRILPGMGFLIGASPASVSPPLLAAAIAWNKPTRGFRAGVAGSGQQGAALAVGAAMADALRSEQGPIAPAPEPGRANVISCGGYMPRDTASCRWQTDPRGAGLAVGSN